MGTTIAEKIQIIKNNRDAIWQAIVDKGGNITGNFLTYADAISGISGGSSSVKRSDVNFYDYDGTILYSYTMADFLALSSMPKLPTRDGLICQGWNYDIEDAKEHVEEYGVLNIGATYITDDGKTRLYIDVAADGRKDVPLNVFLIPGGWHPEDSGDVSVDPSKGKLIIDWGDGNIEEFVGCDYYQLRHRYQEIGNYVISIDVNEGYELLFGSYEANSIDMTSETRSVMFNIANGYTIDKLYANMLKRVEIGNNVSRISNYAFSNCESLSSITIPNSVISIGERAFDNCALSSIVIPNSVTSISEYSFTYCESLTSIVIPNSVTSISSGAFYGCYSLSSIIIPNSITSIENSVFYNCYSLSSVVIPNSVTSVEDYAFMECGLSSVVIPNSVTSVGVGAFSCNAAKYYDFSHHTSIPTLYSSNIFGTPEDNWYILVPSHLYDTWINEPNWCDYADRIITDKSIIDNDDQSGEPTWSPEE